MFIKEVILDGFKSYAKRTVVSGFDPEFNAITGLNGSGKSNILDAICFVLGISNLSQVRASSLQELVYKQGQAHVKKASVTIVFDNTDPDQSPVGYESFDTITITRQVRRCAVGSLGRPLSGFGFRLAAVCPQMSLMARSPALSDPARMQLVHECTRWCG
jgi:chromosome segregation ATPase